MSILIQLNTRFEIQNCKTQKSQSMDGSGSKQIKTQKWMRNGWLGAKEDIASENHTSVTVEVPFSVTTSVKLFLPSQKHF